MADKNLELALKIKADLAQARREVDQLSAALDETADAATGAGRSGRTAEAGYNAAGTSAKRATQSTRQYDTAVGSATRSTRQYDLAINAASTSTLKLQNTTKRVGGGLTSLAASVRAVSLTIAAGFGIREIVKSGDAWTAYENRLRLVTATQGELTRSSADVYAIARNTSQQLDSTAAVYQRFAQNAERLNITQAQSAKLTETVSKAIAISGGSATSAEAATIQFGQALASGVLRGEEFNSVMEQAPGLAMALAEGLGVDIGKLREMANEGELTADVLVNALGAAAASVDKQFETRVRTIAQAATEFNTAFTRIIGVLSSGSGAGEEISNIISDLADLLDVLSDNIDIVGAALEVAFILTAGRVVASLTGMTAEGLRNIAVQKAAATAALEKALADESAAVSAQAAAASDRDRARAAIATAEADVAATAAEARRTAAAAAGSTVISGKAGLDARAAAAATAHAAAEARLKLALEERAIAIKTAAVTTVALNQATRATSVSVAAAAAATSLLTRTVVGLTAVGGRILSMLGGPLGIVLSIGLAATAFLDFGNDAQSGMDHAADATEQASVRIRNASREMIRDLNFGDVDLASFESLGVGADQLEALLATAKATRDYIQQLNDTDIPLDDSSPSLEEAEQKVRALESAIARLRAEQGSARFEGRRSAIEYLDSLVTQNERLQDLSDREKALATLRKEGIDSTSELGKKILAQVDANEALRSANDDKAESEHQATQATEDARRSAEQRAQQQLSFVQQLERQVAVAGKNTAALREYSIVEKGLTGDLLARARAAADAITQQEHLNQLQADAKALQGIKTQVFELQGDPLAAQSAQLEQRYGELLTRLKSRGDAEGVQMIEGLINLRLADTRLRSLNDQFSGTLQGLGRLEQSIQVQREAGLLTEIDARDQLVDLHKKTAVELEKQRPMLDELAQQPGAVGEAARAALAGLDDEILRLNTTMTTLQSTLKEGLETGISSAIQGLADGTLTLRGAVAQLAQSVADAMLKIVSNGLAEMATRQIMQMFTQTSTAAAATATSSAAKQVAAIGTVKTAKVAADTTMAGSAITAANTAVAGTAPAAAESTAQWAGPATTASIGSFGAAAAIGIAAVLAALALSRAFASGGHVRGPGSETSDSIPAMLSDNEFVTRAAVVKQPGALSFLDDFNQRGMVALDDWAGTVRHATGGLAGVPAPQMSSPGTFNEAAMAKPQQQGAGGQPIVVQVNNALDADDLAQQTLSTATAVRQIKNMFKAEKSSFRAILES